MITSENNIPENTDPKNNNADHTNPAGKEENEETKKTVYTESDENKDSMDSGDTSSVADLGRSEFIKKAPRSNKPLGSSHEPGVTPGRDF